ncbi:MAG: branched-chain amino acid ABC transporter permease, partial [Halobacteriales archaeon]|nr:branched-chain amino acid ABC transporter permease [Halobacteriales archaeon]
LAVGVLNGVTWGLTIALIALGLFLILGLLEVINIAHGSLYMLGAVVGWFVVDATGSFLLAVVVAPVVVGLLGVVVERGILRRIEEDVPITLIATFGLMLVFQQLALILFGPGTRPIPAPTDARIVVGSITYSAYRLGIAAVSLVLIAALSVGLRSTRHGLWMRGVWQDRETARAMGVPVSRVSMLTFGLGAALAALAGVLIAPVVSVNHLMGLDVLAIAFIVVIVGGLGSMRGVLIASLGYALLENLGSIFISPVEARLLTLVILIAIVVIRPDGIVTGASS